MFQRGVSLSLCSSSWSTLHLSIVPHLPKDFGCILLIYAYLGRVKVDALYTFAPGTSQMSAVISRRPAWLRAGRTTVCTYKSCLCAFGDSVSNHTLEYLFAEQVRNRMRAY